MPTSTREYISVSIPDAVRRFSDAMESLYPTISTTDFEPYFEPVGLADNLVEFLGGAITVTEAAAIKREWYNVRRAQFLSSNAEERTTIGINSFARFLAANSIHMESDIVYCTCCVSHIRFSLIVEGGRNAQILNLGLRTPVRARIPHFGRAFVEGFEEIFAPILGTPPRVVRGGARLAAAARYQRLQRRNNWGQWSILAENHIPRRELAKPRSSTGNFTAFIEERSDVIAKDTRNIIDMMPISPHGSLATRRWGIEVECVASQGVERPSGWNRKYDGSLSGEHYVPDDHGPTKMFTIDPVNCPAHDHSAWYREYYSSRYVEPENCEFCGEVELTQRQYDDITNDNVDTTDGAAEFVSPILSSYHSRGLESLLEQIALRPSNTTPGIHVHVDAADLNAKQVGAVVYLYGLLDQYLEPHYRREEREYCNSWDPAWVADAVKSAKKVTRKENVTYPTRYATVNLQALEDHGTIEFRAMGPVYAEMNAADSYLYLVRWASFVREIVQVASSGVPMKELNRIKNVDDLIDIFIKYGKEYNRSLEVSNAYEE